MWLWVDSAWPLLQGRTGVSLVGKPSSTGEDKQPQRSGNVLVITGVLSGGGETNRAPARDPAWGKISFTCAERKDEQPPQ